MNFLSFRFAAPDRQRHAMSGINAPPHQRVIRGRELKSAEAGR